MEQSGDLTELLGSHFEWLAVRENGRTLPLRSDEIDIVSENGRTLFGFVDEKGFAMRRIGSFESDGAEIVLNLSAKFGSVSETVRLIPRESAAELSANIEFARLEKANEAARIIIHGFPGTGPVRVSLNTENGRLAQILVRTAERKLAGILYDVTASLTHETIIASALKWLDRLRSRKKDPAGEVWIAAEKRQARNLQRLHATLNSGARGSLKIVVIDRTAEPPTAKPVRELRISELWREKAKRLSIPSEIVYSPTTRAVIDLAPDSIDVVFSKQGETLRFNGLPFARIRRLMGKERAWFGIERSRRPLTSETWESMLSLVAELRQHRSAASPARRHELFRRAPEAWLESILRRNIKLLDANLELSPIYNQFRSTNDKIDLLAIRRDGRLVIIELKTSPDRESVLQAADYWRKIELQRRKGILQAARLFGDKEIADRPVLVYAVAPALSFHRDFEYFARMLSPEIELWRWELHENWRSEIQVLARRDY